MFKFEVTATDKKARVGKLISPHGVVETPLFLPVATQASVKSLTPGDLKKIGCGMLLSNTYHLFLRPGAKTISKLGGLHKFMDWNGSILTDSGGFQVFSLHFFSPEISVETQIKLGADFIVALDECTSPLHDYDYTKISMERSHRWEMRSLCHPELVSGSQQI